MEFIGFKCFEPPTLDTFARHYRQKVWSYLIRAMQDRNEPARAAFWLGNADMGIKVLYDINHPAAYRALERYNLVFRICQGADDKPGIADQKVQDAERAARKAIKIY